MYCRKWITTNQAWITDDGAANTWSLFRMIPFLLNGRFNQTIRTRQGINTDIKTPGWYCGNDAVTIENYINNAYNILDIPPVADLLIRRLWNWPHKQHHITHLEQAIAFPIIFMWCWRNQFDAGDRDGQDHSPERRTTGDHGPQVHELWKKPSTQSRFYKHPITALGWQNRKVVQLCSEVIADSGRIRSGKSPVQDQSRDRGAEAWSCLHLKHCYHGRGSPVQVANVCGVDGYNRARKDRNNQQPGIVLVAVDQGSTEGNTIYTGVDPGPGDFPSEFCQNPRITRNKAGTTFRFASPGLWWDGC